MIESSWRAVFFYGENEQVVSEDAVMVVVTSDGG